MDLEKTRQHAFEIFREAVEAANPKKCVLNYLSLDGDTLVVGSKKYNLSELANGSYILKLKTDTTTKILPITITKDNLKIDWENPDTM